jgi:hypothetical protein
MRNYATARDLPGPNMKQDHGRSDADATPSSYARRFKLTFTRTPFLAVEESCIPMKQELFCQTRHCSTSNFTFIFLKSVHEIGK